MSFNRNISFWTDILQRHNTENSKHIIPERNSAALVPILTFMFMWAIYIFQQSVCLFCCRKKGGPIVEIYLDHSQTHECGNWDWGRAIPFLGIHKSKFFAVHCNQGFKLIEKFVACKVWRTACWTLDVLFLNSLYFFSKGISSRD